MKFLKSIIDGLNIYTLSVIEDNFKKIDKTIAAVESLAADGQLTEEQYEELIISINSLVKKGRVGETVLTAELRDKINNAANGVLSKADKSEAFLKKDGININDFDDPTKQTFLEAQGIDVNYVLGEGNVEPVNTTFVEEVTVGSTDENLNSQFTMQGRLGTVTGSFIEDTSYRATDFIAIEDAEFFFRYVNDGSSTGTYTDYAVVYYDENYDYITGESAGTDYTVEQHKDFYGRKYEIPEGAVYVRFSIPAGNSQDGTNNLYTYLKVVAEKQRRFVNDYNTHLIEQMTGGVDTHLSDKTIACFGDSIFGNFRDGTGITDTMIEQTGATVHNFGFGGTTMAIRDGSNPQDQYWDEFSMTRIADYIYTLDFTPMDAALAGMNSPLDYFADVIAELKTINWNDVDIITIEHGTNDFSQGIPAKDEQDLMSRETYYGAYVYALERILTAYPHIKVVLLTPSWRYWRDGETYIDGADTYQIAGQTMLELVNVVYDVRDVYHVPVINNYHDTNFNKFTRDIYFQDGVHLNQAGRVALGNRVAHQLLSIV